MLLYFCLAFGLIYAGWIIYISSAFRLELQQHRTPSLKFVTVIVPVRNEAHHIVHLLEALKRQTFNKNHFEVLIVNDHSDDETVEIVNRFLLNNSEVNFRLIHSLNDGKKGAIEEGIKQSTGEIIVTTDGDCIMGHNWLQVLYDAFITNEVSLLAAPVMIQGSGSIIQLFQEWDYMAMQVCGLGSLRQKLPLLCSGANLAFGKSDFYNVNGYYGNGEQASGDDTFLMLKMAKLKGCAAVLDSNAVVTAQSMPNLKSVIAQRVRWGSKVKHYQNSYISGAGLLVLMVNALFIFSLGALVAGNIYPFMSMVFLKMIPDLVVLMKGFRFFNIRYTFSGFLMFIIHPFLQLFISLLSLRGSYEWKGRRFRS